MRLGILHRSPSDEEVNDGGHVRVELESNSGHPGESLGKVYLSAKKNGGEYFIRKYSGEMEFGGKMPERRKVFEASI